jgi:long-chain acyl-CoA synthetase
MATTLTRSPGPEVVAPPRNTPSDTRIGTVGRPIPGVSVKISDDGEILVKGDNVCAGYWQDPAATGELIDTDGWMHTGDLGRLEPDGYLRVTGRKKDLIITAYGKNISPEEIETSLRKEPLIAQAVVVGDDRPYLTALLTVETGAALEWAQHEGRSIAPADLEALTMDPDLHVELGGRSSGSTRSTRTPRGSAVGAYYRTTSPSPTGSSHRR